MKTKIKERRIERTTGKYLETAKIVFTPEAQGKNRNGKPRGLVGRPLD